MTALGLRIVAPLEEGDDEVGLRDAALIPTVERVFLEKYDGSPLPAEKIGCNVLETMGVPASATERILNLILENAKSVGFLKVIKDKTYVDLGSADRTPRLRAEASLGLPDQREGSTAANLHEIESAPSVTSEPRSTPDSRRRRVFISHGKSRRVVDQLKELLTFGDFEPVISIEHETVSKPVSQKVLDDMRSCGAGIIHVKTEDRLLDPEGNERRILNQNVLIEIGAAMALYGEHFILLVEDGSTLPSNLQGLYEVRYSGEELGYDATMKVLKALTQFKSSES
ncbi:MAG: TIR domain-containing protein [Sulfobacillus sp.]